MFPLSIDPYAPDGVNVGEEFSDRADWPGYLRIFRHKLWTDRLPKAAERHKRGDLENGELVPPHCPHCPLVVVAETQTHLLHTFPAAMHRAHILNRDINNLFRKYTEPYVPHSTIDVPQWATQANITLEREDRWTSGIADKHDRIRILRRGPAVYHMGSQRFAEPWLQHILQLNKHSHG